MIRKPFTSIEVDEAKAFVESMDKIEEFRNLKRNWNGDGTKPPMAKAMASAVMFLKQRQTICSKFRLEAGNNGDISIFFVNVEAPDESCCIHIDAFGKPAIVKEDDKPEDAERYQSISFKEFKKAVNTLVGIKKSKWKSRKVELDGIIFDSANEAKRYQILKAEERLGRITGLERQVSYPFFEDGKLCFTYKSDFNYTTSDGEEVVEDVKGMPTDVYLLKKKLIEARYKITITEWPVSKKELARRAREEAKRLKEEERERKRLEREAERDRRKLARSLGANKIKEAA
jgi:hypothetical protein